MTIVQNDRSKFLLFQGNGFQRWCDSMGIPQIKLNSQYWTKLRHRIDTASEVIFQYQQENFRRAILDNDQFFNRAICESVFSELGQDIQKRTLG